MTQNPKTEYTDNIWGDKMKKLLLILLTLTMLISVSACGNVETENKVTLPIKGHFSVIGDIIVETDKISATNDVIPNARAFTFKDSEFYKLKRYEAEITIPKKHTTYGEDYGKDISLPVQYFISNSTVYAYLNVDRKEMGGFSVEIIPIPRNDECVIMQSLEVLPLYVNLKSGKIAPVFDKGKHDFDMSARVTCVSEDGKYVAVLGTRIDEMIPRSYIINLKNFEIAEIPLPQYQYNEEYYKLKNSYPSVFADGRLYVNYKLTELDIDGGETVGACFYDVKKKKSEALAAPLTDYAGSEQYPYIQMKFENETGTLKIKNLKDVIDYSFSVYPSNGLWGSPNKTGQYFIGTYFDMLLAGYDENGQPYYENNPQNQKHITIDAKNQKRIDLTKVDNKFNYTTYDGKACVCYWISETELIITCHDGEEEYIQTVINVKDAEQ